MTLRTSLLCALALGACDRAGPPKRGPVAEAPPAVTPAPPSEPAPSEPVAGSLTGVVAETMNSGGYTYLRIGEQWAAVTETKVAVGETVTVAQAMEMKGFESKTLGRTFDSILFGRLGGGDAAANPHATATATAKQPTTGPVTLAQPIARADGGKTITEVFAQQAQLVDQPVTLRGQVTKFNADILGKNWLHLQDGTGTAAQKDFDLTVTTAAMVQLGDVVVVEGPVHTNRDFGAGYKYDVLIEDAKVTVEPR